MGNTAMQEVATVLVAHSGLVPEGSSRSRAASELAEMFARADGETEALPDKEATLLVYCRSGRRSKDAAQKLLALGYQSVYDFGGVIDWPYELVKEG